MRLLIVLLLAAFPACAGDAPKADALKPVPVKYEIFPQRSWLRFAATQNDAVVNGEFRTFAADVLFHPENPEAGHVKVVIDIGSLASPAQEVVQNLLTPAWFDAAKHQQAVFETTKIILMSPGHYLAEGTLTLKGIQQPVTMNFMYEPLGDEAVMVTGAGTLKRSDFNVGEGEWAKTDTVRNEVVVRFQLQAVPKP